MSEGFDSVENGVSRRPLSVAVREMRDRAADRSDAADELRLARIVRLELLADELKPVFDDIPADNAQFDFVLSTGMQPRLWIDATAHVVVDRDNRTYRFQRDSRAGRVVVSETADLAETAAHVTRHIADRLIERQRMLDGPLSPMRRAGGRNDHPAARRPLAMLGEYLSGLLLVVFGMIAGIGILLVILSDLLPDLGIGF